MKDRHAMQQMFSDYVQQPVLDGETGDMQGRPGCCSIEWAFYYILEGMGYPTDVRKEMVRLILEAIGSTPFEHEAAHAVRAVLDLFAPDAVMVQHYLDLRTKAIVSALAPHLRGDTLLDFGCGNGDLALALDAARSRKGYRRVKLHDLHDMRSDAVRENDKFEFTTLVRNLPLAIHEPARQYDYALAVSVLHLCDDLSDIFYKLSRMAKQVVAVEPVVSPYIPLHTQAAMIWLLNRGINPDVEVPIYANWMTTQQWERTFMNSGMSTYHKISFTDNLSVAPLQYVAFVTGRGR